MIYLKSLAFIINNYSRKTRSTMLYHPNSPYYQQFLTNTGNRLGRRADAAQAAVNTPVATSSAAQARAANADKWEKISRTETAELHMEWKRDWLLNSMCPNKRSDLSAMISSVRALFYRQKLERVLTLKSHRRSTIRMRLKSNLRSIQKSPMQSRLRQAMKACRPGL